MPHKVPLKHKIQANIREAKSSKILEKREYKQWKEAHKEALEAEKMLARSMVKGSPEWKMHKESAKGDFKKIWK